MDIGSRPLHITLSRSPAIRHCMSHCHGRNPAISQQQGIACHIAMVLHITLPWKSPIKKALHITLPWKRPRANNKPLHVTLPRSLATMHCISLCHKPLHITLPRSPATRRCISLCHGRSPASISLWLPCSPAGRP